MNEIDFAQTITSIEAAAHIKETLDNSNIGDLSTAAPSLVPSEVLYIIVQDYINLYNYVLEHNILANTFNTNATFH